VKRRGDVLRIAGIGEILWDLLPDGEYFGGAPSNFSMHCSQLGVEAYMVGCIGADARGSQGLGLFKERGVDVSGVTSIENYETGIVVVQLDGLGQPSYQIKQDVAWDHLVYSESLGVLAGSLDAICFGSLAQRHEVSKETLYKFLGRASADCLRVFDINLRKPHFEEQIIRRSLRAADVVKLNQEEFKMIVRMHNLVGSEESMLRAFLMEYDLKLVALTRGDKGSMLVTASETSNTLAREVSVVDTVGAGDAFTSVMVIGLLNSWELDQINAMATRLAAYVCTKSGAVPAVSEIILRELKIAVD